MPKYNFTQPQRQSAVGVLLIFATSFFQIVKNLWVAVFYFAFKEIDERTLFYGGLALVLILILNLGYSIKYYLNFKFHIDEKNEEFVLQKGVFSTEVINIPFQKIQQVNFRRNILQRIIGVYSVVVETAGSQEKEVEIKALSEERANALSDHLMAHAEAEKSATTQENEVVIEGDQENLNYKVNPEWEHKVGIITLIKLGLTSNYLRGIGIIIAFYFTVREQFMFNDEISAQLQEPEVFFLEKKFFFIISLLLIGMLFTVGETVVKYYGLHLQKFKDTLQVEMGLQNNTKVNLRASRIQLLQILSNPVQKAMQLYKVKISLASSENDLEKNQIKIVGLPPDVVSQVKEYFYKHVIKDEFLILPSKYLLLKKISRGLIPLLIVSVILYYFVAWMTLIWFLGIGLSYLFVLVLFNFLYYRNLKLGVSKEFLVRYSGVWIKKEQYLEIFRLQAISVSQPIWYRRRQLVNLTFHSAGGDIEFPMVKKEKVQPLLNYLLYKIEITEKHWM